MGIKNTLASIAVAATILVASTAARAETLSIVGFGDSLMAGYQLPSSAGFPAQLTQALQARGHDVVITDSGVSGDTTADGLARVDWSIPDGTDGVILELGANDVLRGLPVSETRSNLEAIIARLQDRGIPVLLAGMLAPPNMGGDYAATFNAIYPDLAKRHDLMLYPFFLDGVTGNPGLELSDGMHPNSDGIKVMVENFLPVAEQFVGSLQAE
ncbi:(3S)-malyl-CoA thioesterase [Hoeflea marina]|uniref:(3S)-malyl-CoA thioesterase n=1 Tax=Hoeflea marina TaxID=274592 RepID=A0A317PHA9_9HYPH|nr:arylesterase [Hoeflea marina]PWV98281.1 (3S)-malyl-CoA thioesterase [Hoeflea marina]